MFSYISSLVWGAQEETDAENASEVEHSTHEETGEWLVITTGAEQTGESDKSGELANIFDADNKQTEIPPPLSPPREHQS